MGNTFVGIHIFTHIFRNLCASPTHVRNTCLLCLGENSNCTENSECHPQDRLMRDKITQNFQVVANSYLLLCVSVMRDLIRVLVFR